MSVVKRKADSSTKAAQQLPARPHKRQKAADASTPSTAKTASKSDAKTRSSTTVVQKEEKSFPRGGASVLTPLEHKQIQNEATRDVLFEQSTGKRKGGDASDEDGSGASETELAVATKAKTPRKKKKRRENATDGSTEKAVKIEGLSYKRLNTGALVLGQIIEITSRDLAVALPNNLTGYVQLTEVSDHLNKRIESMLAEENGDDSSGSEDNFQDVSLKKLFSVGQFVRAYVLSCGTEGSASGKKRIELSLNPKLANTGLSESEVLANIMLQASVASVEDHGLIMDLGIADTTMKGFLSVKQLAGKDINTIEEGTVLLCLVTGISANGRTATLTIDPDQLKNTKRNFLSTTATVRAYVPGTAVEVLVSDSSEYGIHGKIAGSVDATADLTHLGIDTKKTIEKRFPIGSKIKARVIFQHAESQAMPVGISVLRNVLDLTPALLESRNDESKARYTISQIIEAARVVKVMAKSGLYMDIGAGVIGFAHISRISEKKIEKLSADSGLYKLDSKHKARIIGFNALDQSFLLSLEPKVIAQPFLRIQDVQVGQIVQGTVERLVLNDRGVGGALIKLADGIIGLAGTLHLADVQLQHPERKFREGSSVKARVLAVNLDRRRISLTLKKSLVNTDTQMWSSYDNVKPGTRSLGTIVNLLPTGAVVQFYGSIRGFLPRNEMSEAFIQVPANHFKLGQVVNVRALDVDVAGRKLKVSCKDPSATGPEQLKAYDDLKIGSIISGTISETSPVAITLSLDGALRGVLDVGHLGDGSASKCKSLAKRLHIGQALNDLVVLNKADKRQVITLSQKPEIVKAARSGSLTIAIQDLSKGAKVVGFVRHVTDKLVFVEFAASTVAILPAAYIDPARQTQAAFGYEIGQTLVAWVQSIDDERKRAVLTCIAPDEGKAAKGVQASKGSLEEVRAEPTSNLTLGQITTARITAVKPLQLNVELEGKVPGRVDTSEIFESWADINDWKRPLAAFRANQEIRVRVVGLHDAKSRTYLPFSHQRSNTVFELSMKQISSAGGATSPILHTEKLVAGQRYIGIVSMHADRFILVKLSPSSIGRLLHVNLSDDIAKLQNVTSNFPLGAALHVTVLSIDVEANKVELTATAVKSQIVDLKQLAIGDRHTGRVVNVSNHGLLVQIGRSVAGLVPLTELKDDYAEVDMSKYTKDDLIDVKVLAIDEANKRTTLSARPSIVLSRKIQVMDRQICSIQDLNVNDVVRGFVRNISTTGIFLSIGLGVTAFVKVSDLSDAFHKEWSTLFKIGQLVKGKVLKVEEEKSNALLSLKESILDKEYVPMLSFADLKVGQIHTAKVRKVESFGVFIVLDGSNNVSGLCHRSEIADGKVSDVTKLYEPGDAVEAVVIKVDKAKSRVNFGLKKSYFQGQEGLDEAETGSDASIASDDSEDESAQEGLSDSAVWNDQDAPEEGAEEEPDEEESPNLDVDSMAGIALDVGGFDWNGHIEKEVDSEAMDLDAIDVSDKKRRKKKPTITVDKTGELDKYGPQGVADFERLLLGKPNSSSLWIQYMAFQLGLGEVDKARAIAERAIKTINMREEDEKLNMWIAMLNLENTYGSEESLDDAFKRACGLNDKREIHERLVSIFIESDKHDKAEEIFQQMTKMKEVTAQTQFWLNYATFLLTSRDNADGARSLLMRAMQSVPEANHRNLTAKFGALEFTSPNGDTERGRTVFEGLLSTWPKRTELWDMYVDLEQAHGGSEDNVRQLYERMAKTKLKKRRAKFVFKKWLDFEQRLGDAARVDHVTALATAYVKKMQADGDDE